MEKSRIYSLECKAAAVKRLQQGESAAELARELEVPRERLYAWYNTVMSGRPLRVRGRPWKRMAVEAQSREPADRVQELERLLGQVTAESRFFKGALQRVEEVRQQNKKAGAAVSTQRSKR